MAHEHSYGATLKNNLTENLAVDFLLSSDTRFRQPNKEQRREILNRLGLPMAFNRSFDLVLLPSTDIVDVLSVPAEQLILIELKTTRKKLIDSPNGFFFGATENEFKLANKLGDKYRFCFVSLHPDSRGYKTLT